MPRVIKTAAHAPVRLNANLTKEEAAIKRQIAASHGYTAPSGPHAGQGSAFMLDLALVSGEIKMVLLNDYDRLAVWLLAQTTGDVLLDAELHSLARQLAE